ncbi:MAG: hypothetical protein AAFY56_09565 [Pseudomonadota bacterium]
MSLLHVSINARAPERVALVVAELMGGRAMPFPPFPDSWIAFAARDDGSAIEVYPTTHVLQPGPNQIACIEQAPADTPTFVHAAIASPMPADEILRCAEAQDWLARRCDRGPFECIEVWLENRLLVEVLDPAMQADYHRGMTMANWARMFGMDDEPDT